MPYRLLLGLWRTVWGVFEVLNCLTCLGLLIGGPIFLIREAIRSPIGARNFILFGVAVGVGLVPVHYLFRNARNTFLNGLLLVFVLVVLTCCLMPLALALFSD